MTRIRMRSLEDDPLAASSEPLVEEAARDRRELLLREKEIIEKF